MSGNHINSGLHTGPARDKTVVTMLGSAVDIGRSEVACRRKASVHMAPFVGHECLAGRPASNGVLSSS